MSDTESPHEFEQRGLELARALHDPMGTQGALMVSGRERDGVFVTHDDVHAYEFTLLRTKDKASKDAEKLAELLGILGRQPGNAFKPLTGWFVTRDEPTADQRTTVAAIARRAGRTIHAIGIAQMYKRICNSQMYLQARDLAPFGSISSDLAESPSRVNVPVRLESPSGARISVKELANRLLDGDRLLVTGDYGVGKSHALRELYRALRKEHLKRGHLTPFPIHINLRDCTGLRTPAEILRRHAEEIGFDHPSGLIAAWRAGMCVLLLDGFDEVVPSLRLGSAFDMKTVRWEALSAIRRLVQESPGGAGVAIAGRSHYFSGVAETTSALGLESDEIYHIPDFDQTQLKEFLAQAGADWSLPDWAPARPLLLGYLVAMGEEMAGGIAIAPTRAAGWRKFYSAICAREARMFRAVRPETIERIISRVATLARSRASITGPVDMELLQAAFTAVNGFQPDREGVQLLQRLPGLAGTSGPDEMRMFVDQDLAETAYGLELVDYVHDPYSEAHPLSSAASWVNAAGPLGIEVCAETLESEGSTVGTVVAALTNRQKAERYDAVSADLVRVATEMSWDNRKLSSRFLVSGVAFEELEVVDHPVLAVVTFHDCLVEQLYLGQVDQGASIPHFQGGLIAFVDGVSAMPKWLAKSFTGTTIERYSSATQTTAGIMQLEIDRRSRIALTILKKVYWQRGSARMESALSRGLSLPDRELVPEVLDALVSQGWVRCETSGKAPLYVGIKDRRAAALRALDAPSEFRLR